MTPTKLILALTLILSVPSATWAQSQRNYGANTPAKSDCYGGPYSGSVALQVPRLRVRATKVKYPTLPPTSLSGDLANARHPQMGGLGCELATVTSGGSDGASPSAPADQ